MKVNHSLQTLLQIPLKNFITLKPHKFFTHVKISYWNHNEQFETSIVQRLTCT